MPSETYTPSDDDPDRPAVGEDQPAVRAIGRDLAAMAYRPPGARRRGTRARSSGWTTHTQGVPMSSVAAPAEQGARRVVHLDEAQVLVQEQLRAG